MKKIINITCKSILYLILVLLVFISLVIITYVVEFNINKTTGKTTNPLVDSYIVVSDSMSPTIEVNDLIVIRQIDAKNIKENDIISYKTQVPPLTGTVITHRVNKVYKEENGYIFKTKGDKNLNEDSWNVTEDEVLGKVLLIIPKVGIFRSFILKNIWLFIIVAVLSLGIIVNDLLQSIKKLFKKSKKRK